MGSQQMRKSRAKLPRDPAQKVRIAVASAVAEAVDVPTVPIARIYGYRPEWSAAGREKLIDRSQEILAKQARAAMRKAGPTLEKVIALWRGTKFAGERQAARAQGTTLANRVGLTFDQAVAAVDAKRKRNN